MQDSTQRIKDLSQPHIQAEWNDLFQQERCIHQLENQILPAFLKRMRWFGGKARMVTAIKIYQNIPLETTNGFARYLLLKVRYPDGPTEIYALPLVFVNERYAGNGTFPAEAVLARIGEGSSAGYLIDGIYDEAFRNTLFLLMNKRQIQKGDHYPLLANSGKFLNQHGMPQPLESKVLNADQSNSAIIFNNAYFLKLFRKVEYMINPDWEIVNFLTNQDQFHQLPAYAGSIELQHPEKPTMLLVILQQLVPNQGDAWKMTLNHLSDFYTKVIQSEYHLRPLPIKPHVLSISWEKTPEALRDLIGEEVYHKARLLGKRTAEFHLALMAGNDDPSFAPEEVDAEFQQKLYKELMQLVESKFELLERNIHRVPLSMRGDAGLMLNDKEKVKHFFSSVLKKPLQGKRIRIHGDYHLGQVLVSNDDYFLLDFEGEPDKPHNERRDKYPSLKDVAGMMRSYRYAAYASLFQHFEYDQELQDKLMAVADLWYHFVSRYFLGAYLETTKGTGLIPSEEKVNDLLQIYSFQKAIYELGYEINNRPDWALIPLQSLTKFVKHYID
ncbi:MAG: hypothetical protein RLZZ543_811 [Bacteroidota bacterium]|jgi:maltose alpha-D-glucosyltransferase/alpha-amylase